MTLRAMVAGALALVTVTGCLASRAPDPEPEPSGSASAPLPIIGLDPCPGADQLLASDATGDTLPDVTLACLGDGPAVPLRRIRGPAVINLWASWCGPCRTEMPAYQRVYRDLESRVIFLGINTKDSRRSARETVQLTTVNYPSVVDPTEEVRRSIGGVAAIGLPLTLLIDERGRIVRQLLGEQSEEDLREAIRKDLGVAS